MTKKDAKKWLDRLADDEPCFIIRAHDQLAPKITRNWAAAAFNIDAPAKKIQDAIAIAEQMEAWQQVNGSKVPD